MSALAVQGHNKIKAYFSKIIQENRVPHAMLFNGPKGAGKLYLAKTLSKSILCTDIQNGEACNRCASCNKVDKGIHPDLHYAFPVTGIKGKKREAITSKDYLAQWRQFMSNVPFGDVEKWTQFLEGGDSTFNINVTEANQIIRQLSLQSYEGGYKVQIIWAAEYLDKESNRLLKLIEEPSSRTLIILIAENQDKILNTILSRCQIIRIPPFEDAALAEYLNEEFELTEKKQNEIVHLASGNMDLAMDLSQSADLDFSDQLLEWLRAAHSGHMGKIMAWINPMLKNGKAIQKAFLSYGLHFLKEYMRSLHFKDLEKLRLLQNEKNSVIKMQRLIDFNKAEKLIEIFNQSINLISRNANNRLMFINQSLRIETILKS